MLSGSGIKQSSLGNKNLSHKVALVDFDGVILRNKKVHGLVQKRIESYVGSILKSDNKVIVKNVNKYLYNEYGHTLIGLEKIVGRDNAGRLEDYNDYVYSNLNIDRDDYYEIRRQMTEWNMFLGKCKSQNIPIYIFSNAPKDWCLNFIEEKIVNGFVDDILPMNTELLKPDMRVFEIVGDWFAGKSIYFIDDKIHNMKHTIPNSNWVNIIFSEDNPQSMFKLQDRLYVSNSLNACGDIICF